jgi:hypothetical protein
MITKTVIYDIETLKSAFCYVDIDKNTQEINKFVIHKEKNQIKELLEYFDSIGGQIGFNVNSFDYSIIHLLLTDKSVLKLSAEELILKIYNKAQDVINSQNEAGFSKNVPEWKQIIPQLDLFLVHHYNNKARRTSLKQLQISMNYPNVQDMPIPHDKENITLEELDDILDYCLNDVLSTCEFYRKTVELGKIDLRHKIKEKYKLPCLNWNNGKIGERLLLDLYCKKTNNDPREIRLLRSKYDKIELKDCIPNNIVFKSQQFNNLLKFYENKVIVQTKGSVNYSVVYKGLKYDYGTGGLHGAISSGVYKSDEKYIIKSLDVASLYPNLPIVYGFYINHLGPEFLDVYQNEIVGVRLAEKAKPKDQQDKAIIDGFKEAANIPYGKSNDENSFLYDPLYSMKTTIAGQLVISMLCERLSEIPDSQMLMVNTDGCEIKIPRNYENLYKEICIQWKNDTKLILEFTDYSKMWINDVNNYGCLSISGKIKNKGRLEVDKVIGSEPAYHKDNSFRIVPLAIEQYFTKGIKIEETIRNHRNIYDFCGREKTNKDCYSEIRSIKQTEHGPELVKEKQQKTTRYYISTDGNRFLRVYTSGKQEGGEEAINKGYKVTVFNRYIEKPFEEYNLDYSFYISEVYKVINVIESNQLKLF